MSPHQDIYIKDKRYPSVTEVTGILDKPYLRYWYGKVGNDEANRISTESMALGTQVHGMIEKCLLDQPIGCYSGEAYELFTAWLDWWDDYLCEIQYIEKTIISYLLKCGGTPDLITKTHIVDWKVSNNEDKLRPLQLAGYARIYYDLTGIKIEKGLIVRIDKKGKVHVKEITNLWKWVPMFVMLRKLYDMVNGIGKWAKKKS